MPLNLPVGLWWYYQPGQGWSRPLNHQNSQISLAQVYIIYYFYYVGHVITHKQVDFRTFYDLGGWVWDLPGKFQPKKFSGYLNPPSPGRQNMPKLSTFGQGI